MPFLTELLGALQTLRLFNELVFTLGALINEAIAAGPLEPDDMVWSDWDGNVGELPADIRIRAGEIALQKVLEAKALAAKADEGA